MIAKIASDYNKPNGLTFVRHDSVVKFLDPLEIKKIPEIGPKTAHRLNKKGIETVFDIRKIDRKELEKTLGPSWSNWLYNSSRGIDRKSVANYRIRKSIGAERTFKKDQDNEERIFERLNDLIKFIYAKCKVKEGRVKLLF